MSRLRYNGNKPNMTQDDHDRYSCEDAVAERLLASECPRCRTLAQASTAPRHSRRPMSAMTAHCPVPTPLLLLLLWTLLVASLSCVGADDPRGAMALQQRQQDPGMLYPLSPVEEYEPTPAKLLALLRLSHQQRAISLGASELESDEDESAEPLPMPLPMYASKESKRGSYMSLCHFKICNMGRKRNLRPRNRF